MKYKDNYKGLPEELIPFNYYYEDGETGHVIMAIPDVLLKEIKSVQDMSNYECPVPIKYVLYKGYRLLHNHVIVDVPYGEFGLEIDESYYEYDKQERPVSFTVITDTINIYLGLGDNNIFDIIDIGHVLIMYKDPTEMEIQKFNTERVELRTKVVENIIFLTMKIGELQWMDIPYNPHMSKYLNISQFSQIQSLDIEFILVDSSTGIIKCKNTYSFNDKFTYSFKKQIFDVLTLKFDQKKYYNDISHIYKKYSSRDIAEMSSNRAKGLKKSYN